MIVARNWLRTRSTDADDDMSERNSLLQNAACRSAPNLGRRQTEQMCARFANLSPFICGCSLINVTLFVLSSSQYKSVISYDQTVEAPLELVLGLFAFGQHYR